MMVLVYSTPSRADWHAASSAVTMSEPSAIFAENVSLAGIIASSMVFSPFTAWPRFCIPAIAASSMAFMSSGEISVLPAVIFPASMYAVPYNGPEAPPTFESKVIPAFFSTAPMSLSSGDNFSITAAKPRAMFMP